MKNVSRRLLVLLLAFASLAALSVPAWAADPDYDDGNGYYGLYDDSIINFDDVNPTTDCPAKTLNITNSGSLTSSTSATAYLLMGYMYYTTNWSSYTLVDPYVQMMTDYGEYSFQQAGVSAITTLSKTLEATENGTPNQNRVDNAAAVKSYLNTITKASETQELAQTLYDVLKDDSWSGTLNLTSNTYSCALSGGVGSFTNLHPGYYLIYVDGTAPILVEIKPDATAAVEVNLKAAVPGVDSTVDSKEAAAVGTNGTVTITVTTTMPDVSKFTSESDFTFDIVDTLPKGLKYQKSDIRWYKQGASSFTTSTGVTTIPATNSEGRQVVTVAGGNTLYTAASGTTPNIYAGDKIELVITALVTADAYAANANEAYVTYSPEKGDSYTTATDTTYIYAYDLPVKVVNTVTNEDNSTTENPLSGATFYLKNNSGSYYKTDGTWVSDKTTATVFTSNAEGWLVANGTTDTAVTTIRGLGADTYTLEQISSVSGYQKAADTTVTVAATSATTTAASWTVTWGITSWTGTASNADTSTLVTQADNVVKIENAAEAVLPTTGAMGAAIIIALGVAAVIAGVVIADRKRGRG